MEVEEKSSFDLDTLDVEAFEKSYFGGGGLGSSMHTEFEERGMQTLDSEVADNAEQSFVEVCVQSDGFELVESGMQTARGELEANSEEASGIRAKLEECEWCLAEVAAELNEEQAAAWDTKAQLAEAVRRLAATLDEKELSVSEVAAGPACAASDLGGVGRSK